MKLKVLLLLFDRSVCVASDSSIRHALYASWDRRVYKLQLLVQSGKCLSLWIASRGILTRWYGAGSAATCEVPNVEEFGGSLLSRRQTEIELLQVAHSDLLILIDSCQGAYDTCSSAVVALSIPVIHSIRCARVVDARDAVEDSKGNRFNAIFVIVGPRERVGLYCIQPLSLVFGKSSTAAFLAGQLDCVLGATVMEVVKM